MKNLFIRLLCFLFLLTAANHLVGASTFSASANATEEELMQQMIFKSKYIPGDTVELEVELSWNQNIFYSSEIVFPAGTIFISASPFANERVSISATTKNDTVKWFSNSGASQGPLTSKIKVIIAEGFTGTLKLPSTVISYNTITEKSDTTRAEMELHQLGIEPTMVVLNHQWNAGMASTYTMLVASGIMVYNDGVDTLRITSVNGLKAPFACSAIFPIKVATQKTELIPFEFVSEVAGYFETTVEIVSNGGSSEGTLTGAAFDNTYYVERFATGLEQFPPAGWQLEKYPNSNPFEYLSGTSRLRGSAAKDSSSMITPAVNLTQPHNGFIGFQMYNSPEYIGHFDIDYSIDEKNTWLPLKHNFSRAIGQNEEYYISVKNIHAPKVYFRIKAVSSYGLAGFDNLFVPALHNPNTIPLCTENMNPADLLDNVSNFTQFDWDRVLFADGYKLYLGTNPVPNQWEDLANVSQIEKKLEQITTYYWQIVPYNQHGENKNCKVQKFKTDQLVPTHWTDNVYDNTQITYSSNDKHNAHVHLISSGESFISWFETENGNINHRLQLLSENGEEKWKRGGILISDNTQQSYIPRFFETVDKDDNFISVFVDYRNETSDAFLYKISPTGEFLFGENGICLTGNYDVACYNTDVRTDKEGNSIVMVGLGYDFLIFNVSPDGEIRWSRKYVGMYMDMEISDNGDALFLLYTGGRLYINGVSKDNVPLYTSNLMVSNNPTIPSGSGYKLGFLRKDINGGIYVVWQGAASATRPGIKYQYINPDKTLATTAAAPFISSNNTFYRAYPFVQYDKKADKLNVIWNEMILKGGATHTGIVAQRLNKATLELGAEGKTVLTPIDTIAGTDAFIMKGDTFAIAYSTYVGTIYFQNYSNVQFFDKEFAALPTNKEVRFSTYFNFKPLDDLDFNNKQMVFLWQEERENDENIFAQNVRWDMGFGIENPDKQIPHISEVKPQNTNELLIVFSENVLKSSVEGNPSLIIRGKNTVNIVSTEMIEQNRLKINVNTIPEGVYTFQLNDFTDLMANTNTGETIAFVVDFTAPVATNIEATNSTTVVLTFSEPISIASNTTFSIDGDKNIDIHTFEIVEANKIRFNVSNLGTGSYELHYSGVTDATSNSVSNQNIEFSTTFTSINDADNVALNVYPNPATDFIYLFANEPIRNINLINTLGQQVLSMQFAEPIVSLPVSALPAGYYFVQIQTDTQLISRKIVIRK